MESDSDDAFEQGTSASIAAALKSGRSRFGVLSEADYRQADLESKSFGLKKGAKVGGTKSKKKQASKDKAKNGSNGTTSGPPSVYDDLEELLMESDKLQRRAHNYNLDKEEKQTKPSHVVTMEIDLVDIDPTTSSKIATGISCNDDDGSCTELDNSQPEGQMLGFYVSLGSSTFSTMIYENEFISELKAKIANKSGTADPESIQMFLENSILEDRNTVKASGILMHCTIDAFILQKTEKELFDEGSASVVQFKMQTEDRRGRQNSFVYVKRTATVRTVRDKYAVEMGFDPSALKLMRDGESLNLDTIIGTLEDLEIEDCLDVVISEKSVN